MLIHLQIKRSICYIHSLSCWVHSPSFCQKLHYVNDLSLFYPILLPQICLLSHGRDIPLLCNAVMCMLQALLNPSTLGFNLKPQPTNEAFVNSARRIASSTLDSYLGRHHEHPATLPVYFSVIVSPPPFSRFWSLVTLFVCVSVTIPIVPNGWLCCYQLRLRLRGFYLR